MNTPAPALSEIVAAAVARGARGLRVSQPARVESYDATTGKISATPWIEEAEIGEDGTRRTVRQQVIPNIPVQWPGGGGLRLTFPLAVGDTVILLYSDRSLDRWLVRGGFVDPADDRAHHESDCIAIPVLYAFGNAPPAPDDRVRLGPPSGDVAIEITDARIRAGGDERLALLSEIQAMRTAYNAHTHTDPVSGITGTPSAAMPAPSGTDILRGG